MQYSTIPFAHWFTAGWTWHGHGIGRAYYTYRLEPLQLSSVSFTGQGELTEKPVGDWPGGDNISTGVAMRALLRRGWADAPCKSPALFFVLVPSAPMTYRHMYEAAHRQEGVSLSMQQQPAALLPTYHHASYLRNRYNTYIVRGNRASR